MFDSFSAHKVKGNEGGKGGKKEKQKEDSSPVRNREVPGLGLGRITLYPISGKGDDKGTNRETRID